jgi:molybdopterin/thiamine biosynthesis adenylyltransferase
MSNNMFLHEEIYRGEAAVKALGETHITICGAGTLGSNLAETLARQGVKSMRLIDMDRVEMHNLNTQAYEQADIGQMKVTAMKNRLFRIAGIEIEVENKELKSQTAKKLLKNTDLIVDTFDNNASRQLLVTYCAENKIELLHAGLNGDYGEVVWNEHYKVPQDQTEGDACEYPLARNLAMFVVSIAAEEIVNFITAKNQRRDLAFTLNDFKIQPYR